MGVQSAQQDTGTPPPTDIGSPEIGLPPVVVETPDDGDVEVIYKTGDGTEIDITDRPDDAFPPGSTVPEQPPFPDPDEPFPEPGQPLPDLGDSASGDTGEPPEAQKYKAAKQKVASSRLDDAKVGCPSKKIKRLL